MNQHIKTYDTFEDGYSGITLSTPWIAHIKSGDTGAPETWFSSGLNQIEQQADPIYTTVYSGILTSLIEKVADLEKLKKNGNEVYLSESEYTKLVNGETAVDMDGEVITTEWDDATVTYYTYEDDSVITGGTNTDTSGTVPEGTTILAIERASVSEDTHTLVLVGGNISGGVLSFTTTYSGDNTDGELIVDDSTNSLQLSSSNINDTTLVLTGANIVDNTLQI